jgi:hypothetical protein
MRSIARADPRSGFLVLKIDVYVEPRNEICAWLGEQLLEQELISGSEQRPSDLTEHGYEPDASGATKRTVSLHGCELPLEDAL